MVKKKLTVQLNHDGRKKVRYKELPE